MSDVAIIGAGLAGTSAAIHLAQEGYQVLLMEAGKYPRAKVCGEFLSPEAFAIFEEMGFLEMLQSLKPVSIHKLRITAPNGSNWCRDLPAPAIGISRFALDKALVDYAKSIGVEFLEECRVNQIEGNLQEGFQIHCQTAEGRKSFQATSLIAAHGKRSNLDKVLGHNLAKQQDSFIGLKQHFFGIQLHQTVDLHVFRGGYCGLSEVEDGSVNVCLLVREDIFQEVSQHQIPRFIDWMGEQNPALKKQLSHAEPVYPDWLSIAQVSLKAKEPIAGDILLAGDAIGMIAPLAGDGMAMALHSGKLAAKALEAFLRKEQDAETMKTAYRYLWQKTFNQRLQLGRLIQSVMLKPKLLSPALRVLNYLPALGDYLVSQTRDLALLE